MSEKKTTETRITHITERVSQHSIRLTTTCRASIENFSFGSGKKICLRSFIRFEYNITCLFYSKWLCLYFRL